MAYAALLSTVLAKQTALRRRQTIVAELLAEVRTMEHSTLEERTELMAKITASLTSSGEEAKNAEFEEKELVGSEEAETTRRAAAKCVSHCTLPCMVRAGNVWTVKAYCKLSVLLAPIRVPRYGLRTN